AREACAPVRSRDHGKSPSDRCAPSPQCGAGPLLWPAPVAGSWFLLGRSGQGCVSQITRSRSTPATGSQPSDWGGSVTTLRGFVYRLIGSVAPRQEMRMTHDSYGRWEVAPSGTKERLKGHGDG